ncbi:MAG: GDSL-type esterase/lipase family protein [Candidatus Helarchaeota archaeon]
MENPCKIIFFGDSITREYVPIFKKVLEKEYPEVEIEVTNAGMIGETSRDGLKRMGQLINQYPQVVIISFGMNDWRKGVLKNEFEKNLSYIIDRFEKVNARVLLTTINPDYQGFFKGSSREIDDYNCIIRGLARKKRIKIADVNSLWKRRIKPVQKGLRDKIHPNKKGYEIYCESLLNVVPQSHTVILWQYNGRECRCNYHCPYCYYVYSPKAENYFWGNIKDWHNAFKKSFGNQRLVFYLAFGEPTLGEAFYDIVKMIEREPKWELRITTNLSQDLERLVSTRLAREGRFNINASFHPTQTTIEQFLEKLLYLRKHNIEPSIVYVMWPPQMKRFESDFKVFSEHNFLMDIRPFLGIYKGKRYPKAYSDEERQFIARHCDDATIKYMLNEKSVFDRRTYSGLHFFVVDCVGNIGYDSDCFGLYTKYRTIFGNIIENYTLKIPLEPPLYPRRCSEDTVDGVSNYLETNYHQLEENNILSFLRQGGVYCTDRGIFYKNIHTNFNDSKIRAEYYFPSRNIKDEFSKIIYLGAKNYARYRISRVRIYMRHYLSKYQIIQVLYKKLKQF